MSPMNLTDFDFIEISHAIQYSERICVSTCVLRSVDNDRPSRRRQKSSRNLYEKGAWGEHIHIYLSLSNICTLENANVFTRTYT